MLRVCSFCQSSNGRCLCFSLSKGLSRQEYAHAALLIEIQPVVRFSFTAGTVVRSDHLLVRFQNSVGIFREAPRRIANTPVGNCSFEILHETFQVTRLEIGQISME